MANMIANIPDIITIPERIKFIGTLNQDATTLDISPKVLDRSYIVRIDGSQEDNIELDMNQPYDELIKYKPITKYAVNERDSEICNEKTILRLIKKLNNVTYYSKRVTKQTFEHKDFSAWCQVMGKNTVIDNLLITTFMPKVRIFENYSDKRNIILEIVGEENQVKYPLARKILTEIDNENEKEIDFWRS